MHKLHYGNCKIHCSEVSHIISAEDFVTYSIAVNVCVVVIRSCVFVSVCVAQSFEAADSSNFYA